jgi:tRNA modification GTPase
VELEAGLDFPDEDLPANFRSRQGDNLAKIGSSLDQVLAAAHQGRLLREGIVAVIAGRPNVGKSTLLNRLARRERAIVSHIPGTTRDLVHEDILIDGLAVHITDTAGLRTSPDEIEQEGIRRAHEAASQADLLLVVVDRDTPIDKQEQAAIAAIPEGCQVIIIHNKIDLTGETPRAAGTPEQPEVYLSAQTGAGLDLLQTQIKAAAGYSSSEQGHFSARRRHLDALHRAHTALQTALDSLNSNAPDELTAEELRLAHRALAEITGEFTSEDLLGAIFSTFCIGK